MHKSLSKLLILSIFTVLVLPASFAFGEEAKSISVERAAIALSVVDHEPNGANTTFDNEVGNVSCFSKIVNGGSEGYDHVRHVWYYGDDVMADIKLRVGATSWRTHSTKTIMKQWKGAWKVDIVAPDETVLETLNFTVN